MIKYRLKPGEYFMTRSGEGPFLFKESGLVYPGLTRQAGQKFYEPDGRWLKGVTTLHDLTEHVPRSDTRHPEYGSENI